jgi:hypothetical protein
VADDIAITAGAGTTIATDEVGGRHFQKIKITYGPNDTATDVDTGTPLPAFTPDVTATGNITTQNLVPAGVATAGSAVEVSMAGRAALIVQVTGTYTGVLSIQGTVDGSAWVTIAMGTLVRFSSAAVSSTIGSAVQDIFSLQGVNGFLKLRVTALAAVTGTAVVSIHANAVTAPPSNNSIAATLVGTSAVSLTSTTIAPSATVGGNTTFHHAISANTTNATSVRTSTSNIGLIVVSNINAAARYFKLYNKASAPTVGTDTPILTAMIPAGRTVTIPVPNGGMRMVTGIAYALTTGITVADTGAVAVSEHSVFIAYV